jgi:hypothetical protein
VLGMTIVGVREERRLTGSGREERRKLVGAKIPRRPEVDPRLYQVGCKYTIKKAKVQLGAWECDTMQPRHWGVSKDEKGKVWNYLIRGSICTL